VQAQETCLRGQIAGDKYKLDVRKAELAKYAEELGYLKNRLRSQQELYGADINAYEARNKANRLLTEAAAMVATSRVEILLAQESLALDYDIASRWLSLAQAKILSSEAIAYASLFSAQNINAARNASAVILNAARNASSEVIVDMKLDTQQAVSQAQNDSQLRIAEARAQNEIRLTNVRTGDNDFINDRRWDASAAMQEGAWEVYNANMDAAHAQKYADLSLTLLGTAQ